MSKVVFPRSLSLIVLQRHNTIVLLSTRENNWPKNEYIRTIEALTVGRLGYCEILTTKLPISTAEKMGYSSIYTPEKNYYVLRQHNEKFKFINWYN